MIILRNKFFSLSSRLKNAKNIYKAELEIYEKDRKNPNALLKMKNELKEGQGFDRRPAHKFNDKTKTITFLHAKNSDGSNKKMEFNSKDEYKSQKAKLTKVHDDIIKANSDEHVERVLKEYKTALKHPKRTALKHAIQNLYSDKTEDKNEEKLNKRKPSSKFRQALDKINSIPKKKSIHRFGISSTDAALLHNQAQQQSWQAHVNAVNSHSLATMGMPIM